MNMHGAGISIYLFDLLIAFFRLRNKEVKGLNNVNSSNMKVGCMSERELR